MWELWKWLAGPDFRSTGGYYRATEPHACISAGTRQGAGSPPRASLTAPWQGVWNVRLATLLAPKPYCS